jgi:hypothetical protein
LSQVQKQREAGHELGSTEPMKHKKTKTIFENTKGKHKESEVEKSRCSRLEEQRTLRIIDSL